MYWHYVLIYRYAELINSIFGKNIFILYCANVVILSSSIFQITIGDSNLFIKVHLLIYLSANLNELCFYCYFGERISTEVNKKILYILVLAMRGHAFFVTKLAQSCKMSFFRKNIDISLTLKASITRVLGGHRKLVVQN